MTAKQQDTNNSARDIYADPKLAETPAVDPVQEFINQNWKHFATTILAIFVIIYFVQSFRESYNSSMQASADLFQRLQIAYRGDKDLKEELSGITADPKTTDAAKIEEVKNKIAENRSQFDQLLSSAADAREPYKSLSVLYRASMNESENPTLSKEVLKQYSDWKKSGKDGSVERMNAELGALQLGRLQLQTNEEVAKGRELIKDLTVNGEFVSVAAAKVLAGFASTDAEKSEAKATINSLLSKQPEQADILKDTLNSL